eukprot:scpid97080/ scgid25260/ 
MERLYVILQSVSLYKIWFTLGTCIITLVVVGRGLSTGKERLKEVSKRETLERIKAYRTTIKESPTARCNTTCNNAQFTSTPIGIQSTAQQNYLKPDSYCMSCTGNASQ